MTIDHRMTIEWLTICIHVYMYVWVYSVYKVDRRGAAAPKKKSDVLKNCIRIVYF